ncbi:MAG: hypothetical protein GVY30_10555 [Chloroflexi bacterium]|nr:hypothetical protein [Chloroflexota bacterium]
MRPTRKGISLRMQEPAGGDPCYSLAYEVVVGALSVNGEALEFDTSAREPLVVRTTVYKGQPRVDIRRHYWKEGELRPGARSANWRRARRLSPADARRCPRRCRSRASAGRCNRAENRTTSSSACDAPLGSSPRWRAR